MLFAGWICCLVGLAAFGLAQFVSGAPAVAAASTSRGEAITAAQKQAALVVSRLAERLGTSVASQEVVLKGRIEKVCQAKGCWFTIRDSAEQGSNKESPTVRVTSKGYLFFVPKDLAGRTAFVRGVLKRKSLSAQEAQHFADDEARAVAARETGPKDSKVKSEVAKKAPTKETEEWQLEALGVVWEG